MSSFEQEHYGRVTGSIAAAVLGHHPYTTPHDAWLQITGRRKPEPDNPHFRRGRHLENGVRDWYLEETGYTLDPQWGRLAREQGRQPHYQLDYPSGELWRCDWAGATPDAIVCDPQGERRILEIKCPRDGRGWGPSGSDEYPRYHWDQLQMEMVCADVQRADLVALVYGELRIYTVERDPGYMTVEIPTLYQWWQDRIKADTAPPADHGRMTKEWLDAEWRPDTSKVCVPAQEDEDAARELLWLYEQRAALQEDIDMYEALLKQRLQDATVMAGKGWCVRWSPRKGRKTTQWRKVAEDLGKRLDADVHKDAVARYTKQGADYRVLEVRKEDDDV